METKFGISQKIHLDDVKLLQFFTDNLNRIYCAKKHMIYSFPKIAGKAYFSDIYYAILETIEDVKKQVSRMDEIYDRLNVSNSVTGCAGLVAMIDEAFIAIAQQKEDTALRDMSILYYLQNLESIEVASFHVLHIMAKKMKNPEILQLINENLNEAKEDRQLLLSITAKYIND